MFAWLDYHSGTATWFAALVALIIAVSTVVLEHIRRERDRRSRQAAARVLFKLYSSELNVALDSLVQRYQTAGSNIPIIFETIEEASRFPSGSVFKAVANDIRLPLPAEGAQFAASLAPDELNWNAIVEEVAAYNVRLAKAIRGQFDLISALRKVQQVCARDR